MFSLLEVISVAAHSWPQSSERGCIFTPQRLAGIVLLLSRISLSLHNCVDSWSVLLAHLDKLVPGLFVVPLNPVILGHRGRAY